MDFTQVKTIKKQVGLVLSNYPETRNSDKELVRIVCMIFHHEPLEKASTITRIRRKLNEKGRFLPTAKKVAEQRGRQAV